MKVTQGMYTCVYVCIYIYIYVCVCACKIYICASKMHVHSARIRITNSPCFIVPYIKALYSPYFAIVSEMYS